MKKWWIDRAITALWNWLKDIHSNSDSASSKRFYGGIGWIAVIGVTYFTGFQFIPVDIWESIEPFVNTLTFLATGLLGLDTISKGIRYFKNKPTNENSS